VRAIAALLALTLSACALPGYMYDTGSFVQHPRLEFCASRGQVLDPNTLDCVTPPPPPPPTAMQVAQAQQSNAVTSERNACVAAANAKFQLKAEGVVASHAIWHAELKQCNDLMMSRLVAQKLKSMGADCSFKLDWMLRYRMMVYDPDQKEMAEDRYAEICKPK
jgi:hypothetical protein